jgi:RNA polymerase sigma factor (sigma-70 family)
MQEQDDTALLREYAERDSEAAFAGLVARHINQVYSVALRHTRNPHEAEEITQAVFVILAGKSRRLSRRVILSGWLYQTARLVSVTFLRGQIRRVRREQEACMQSSSNESEAAVWTQIAPLLDAALSRLNETDRHAVVLRFFDGKSLREVGAALGTSEDAAKMRVNRSLEKLREFFAKRGVDSTTTLLAGAMSAHAVQAAPAGLAGAVTALAVTKGAAAGGPTLTLMKGALKNMAWTKMKTAVLTGAGLLLAGGAITLGLTQTPRHPEDTQMTVDEKPNAGEILRQVRTNYAALSTLSDSGTSVMRTPGRPLTTSFKLQFARPQRYMVTLGQGGHMVTYWLADGHEFALADQRRYLRVADDEKNLKKAATGFSGASGLSAAGLFYDAYGSEQLGQDENAFIAGLAAGRQIVRQRDEKVAGVNCYVIEANDIEGFKVTLWIGQKDFLIRQRRMVNLPHPDPKDDITFTETHTNLLINAPLTDDDLTPRIPEGVKLEALPVR